MASSTHSLCDIPGAGGDGCASTNSLIHNSTSFKNVSLDTSPHNLCDISGLAASSSDGRDCISAHSIFHICRTSASNHHVCCCTSTRDLCGVPSSAICDG